MNYKIKSIFGKILFEVEADSLKTAVEEATKNGADLRGANLRDTKLRGANLYRADLSESDLSGADLRGANLYRADLSESDLSSANLNCANLSGADLDCANLSGANLNNANLSQANLLGTDLYEADLSRAKLGGTNLNDAIIRETITEHGKITIPPITITGGEYDVVISEHHIQIGCLSRSIAAWKEFADEDIKNLDGKALKNWKLYRATILRLANIQISKAKELKGKSK